jgi:hypothetical protein
VGLFFVVLAQVAAFFTMAKRSEASGFFSSEQFQRVAANQYPHQSAESLARGADAEKDRANALTRLAHSDVWRQVGLAFFVLSLALFVAGCAWGAWVVILAKEVAAR